MGAGGRGGGATTGCTAKYKFTGKEGIRKGAAVTKDSEKKVSRGEAKSPLLERARRGGKLGGEVNKGGC